MFIRTDRLLLRPSWPDDLDELVELLNEEPVARSIGTGGVPANADALLEMINRPRDVHLPHLFIHLRTHDGLKLIGGIGLGRAGEDVELGYWLARAYWGNGYASEAVGALLEHAWMLGHPRVIARHFADSVGTDRVLAKAGFQETGEVTMRYSAARGHEARAITYVAARPDIPSFSQVA